MSKVQPIFRGIVPPVITPLTPTDVLDAASLERVIDHAIAGGVHGLFLLGTTGEFSSVTATVRREVIRIGCRAAAGRVPVVVGVTDTSVIDSVELARFAAGSGADAIVVSTPYYLPLSQDEVSRYVGRLLSTQPLPVMLYNYPALTKTPIEPETVRRLADDPRIIGVKDSSGDPAYLRAVAAVICGRPDFSILVGGESRMIQAIRDGAHGCVGGGANIAPRILVDLYEAVIAQDPAKVGPLKTRLDLLGSIIHVADGVSGVVKGTKYAVSRLGLCDEKIAEPFLPLTPPQRRVIDGVLEKLGLAAGHEIR